MASPGLKNSSFLVASIYFICSPSGTLTLIYIYMCMEYYLPITHTEKLRKRRRAVNSRLCGKGSHAESDTPAHLHNSVPLWFWNISLRGHKESSEPVLGILPCLGLPFPVPDLMCTSLFCLCCGGM